MLLNKNGLEPTPASVTRRLLAERIAPAYAVNSKVAAVILGGSAARGHADRYSDMEVGVFWHEPPTETDRRGCIERAGGDLHHLYAYEAAWGAWHDDWKIGRNSQGEPSTGVSVDMPNFLVDTVGQTLDALLNQHNPDLLKQILVSGLQTGTRYTDTSGFESGAMPPSAIRTVLSEPS